MNIYLEIFGYIGTFLVILSMIMSNIKKLRIINILGSIITVIYSVLVDAWPIVVLNSTLIIINSIHLIKDYYKLSRLNNCRRYFNIKK